jgi:predicted DCC family thiol-disulfide oxidoreductase YuxK
MKMSPTFPLHRATSLAGPMLTVFYDGSCALCSAEMQELARLDRHHELALVDCAAADFDDRAWRAEGVSRADMLAAMHVRDVLGDWHRGVDAFSLIYATVGAPWLARLWAHPLTRPITQRLYPWIVRHRHQLSALGLHLVAPRVLRLLAWRSARHARCEHGACRMPAADTPSL